MRRPIPFAAPAAPQGSVPAFASPPRNSRGAVNRQAQGHTLSKCQSQYPSPRTRPLRVLLGEPAPPVSLIQSAVDTASAAARKSHPVTKMEQRPSPGHARPREPPARRLPNPPARRRVEGTAAGAAELCKRPGSRRAQRRYFLPVHPECIQTASSFPPCFSPFLGGGSSQSLVTPSARIVPRLTT